MAKRNIIFNSELETFGNTYILNIEPPAKGAATAPEERSKMLALLFEQFLLFDKIALKIDRNCLALRILIKELGINRVQELLERRTIIPVLWTPIVATSTGQQQDDGTINREAVIGRRPLVSGTLTDEDSDPERNIEVLLSNFQLDRERKRIFVRKVRDKYILPDITIANQSVEIVLDAYNNNRLEAFGLPAVKEPEQLDYLERGKLRDFGGDILETTFLAQSGFKSYERYSYYTLAKESVQHIESAYRVSENTSEIFTIENLANIRDLVVDKKLPFDSVFEIRNRSDVKAYRKWINSNSVSMDAGEISRVYIDAVEGKKNAWTHGNGKLLRTGLMFGIGAGLGSIATGALGLAAGAALTIFDAYVLDSILKGWNPRMFVDEIKYEAFPASLENP